MMIYWITAIYAGLFLVIYLKNRLRLLNGVLVGILFLLFGFSLISLADQTGSRFLFGIVVILATLMLLVVSLSTFVILIVTFVSSLRLIKKEGFTFANLLSLFSGLALLVWIIINSLVPVNELSKGMYYGLASINAIVLYLLFVFINFFISSLLYQFYRPILKQQYIIVLGSGLMNGSQVTPLLKGRIDRALDVYRKQKGYPMLIMSGGRGEDELVSEAYAMKEYAISQGIDEHQIIMEDQSKNTYENLLFSKRIIETREQNPKKLRILFSTTNYHVFRAGIYASKVKLKAKGIGASTRFYFWLNALLREYIAILEMNKKVHLVAMSGWLILSLTVCILFKEETIMIRFIEMLRRFR